MSYSELCNKFELVTCSLKQGGQAMTSLCSFFTGYRKLTEHYTRHLAKLNEGFALEIGTENNMDTLSAALFLFTEHLKKQVALYTGLGHSLQLEIIHPLELFLEHFTSTNAREVNKGAQLSKQLKKAQERMRKLRSKYYQASAAADKAEASTVNSDPRDKQEKVGKHAAYQRALANKALKLYDDSVNSANSMWDEFDAGMPVVMDSLQQGEESRINFTRIAFENFAKSQEQLSSESSANSSELLNVFANVNSAMDIRILVDMNKTNNYSSTREQFTPYEVYRDSMAAEITLKDDDYEIVEENTSEQDLDTQAIMLVLDSLIPDTLDTEGDNAYEALDPTTVNYTKFSELLHTPDGRVKFMNVLEGKKLHNYIPLENMIQLAALAKSMLTAMVIENDCDPYIFCRIVVLSHVFYTEEGNKRKYLTFYLMPHNIWTEVHRWVTAIEFAASQKFEADKECMRRFNSKKKRNLFNTFRQLADKLPSVFQKDQTSERAEKSAVYSMISQFNFHMIHIGLSVNLGTDVILEVTRRANLDSERTCHLLAELQANQKTSLAYEEPSRLSVLKCKKAFNKWGHLLSFVRALEFLTPEEALTVLLVCKAWNKALKPLVVQKLLLESRTVSAGLRRWCWIAVLQVHSRDIHYADFLQRVMEDSSIIQELADVIDMDAARSFQENTGISQDNLKNILKTFAFYHPEVGYCQGMNYIAGTLFLQLQDEADTFKCIHGMIEKFEMKDLFMNHLPKLKQFFFELDRLIGILIPEVHESFKEAGVAAGHFSSSWFITIFSSTIQSQADILLQIWDLFIVHGWKIIFKVILCILHRKSGEFVGGMIEDIMFALASLSQPDTQQIIFDDSFIQKMQQIPVSNRLLRTLEEEYKALKVRASCRS